MVMSTPARLPRIAALLITASASALHAQSAPETAPPAVPAPEDVVVLEKFVTEDDSFDPNNVVTKAPVSSAIGFDRKLEETPRSISVVSSELIDKIGIRDGDQLYQVVPGTFTVNRWGIAGATQVRGLPADTYLRGMKRIDPQGNIRNVITMWDQVEIVRGPPSPIFGNGRIGGYTNYVPKSVRGTTGKYLEKPTGSITLIGGSYDRAEMQFNYSQPLTIAGREAGVQVFAQANDSDSYYEQNFQKDRVLQASFSMNLGPQWHIESGAIFQRAVNAGQAGSNRVDQSTFDSGLYLRGTALVNLDRDGNGTVSEKEIQDSRSYSGYRGARPLAIYYKTPLGGNNVINGVPQSLKDLLGRPEYAYVANTPVGQAILASPTAAVELWNASGTARTGDTTVPVGFFLDPTTVGYSPRDWSLVAIEEEADGHTFTGYFDIIDDGDPDATMKNQLFYDYQKQRKESQLPFNQRQEITAVENKFTITRKKDRLPFANKLPEWVNLDMLASANIRYTDAGGISTTGDYDGRRDLMTGYTPTDTFTSFIRSGDTSFATGEPISGATFSEYIEYGAGVMVDTTFWNRLGILGGLRYDYIDAETFDDVRYDRTGNAANASTGGLLPRREASGSDDAISKSISVNYKTGWFGLTPYGTFSKASAALAGTRLDLAYGNVLSGNILSEAELKEAGFKGSTLNDKLYYAVSVFDQVRSGNVEVEGESYIRSTRNKGVEVEIRYVPNKHWSFIATATHLSMKRVQLQPGTFRTALVTAEYLGYQDIKDANGNVLLPANALLWGGNPQVLVSADDRTYDRFGQYPAHIYTGFVGYNFDNGLQISLNTSWVSETAASSELWDLLTIPSYTLANLTVAYDLKDWRFSAVIRNLTDEEYFTANNGSFGGALLQAGLPRNFEFSVTRRF